MTGERLAAELVADVVLVVAGVAVAEFGVGGFDEVAVGIIRVVGLSACVVEGTEASDAILTVVVGVADIFGAVRQGFADEAFEWVIGVCCGDAAGVGDVGDVVGEVVLVVKRASIGAGFAEFTAEQVISVVCFCAIGGGNLGDPVLAVILIAGDAVEPVSLADEPVDGVIAVAAAVLMGIDEGF